MTDKTHYRKAFKSPYLASADIVEPTVLTVAEVKQEADRTKRSSEVFNTAFFKEKEIRPGEKLKPMVLNAHNCEVLRKMCGSAFIEDWKGVVTVYVDPNVRFGRETVEGLRLKAGADVVSADQAKEIQELLDQTGSDVAKFCKHFGCGAVTSLPASKFGAAKSLLSRKAQAK